MLCQPDLTPFPGTAGARRPALCHADMLSAQTDAHPDLAAPLSGPPLYSELPADVLSVLALCIPLVSLKKHSGEITETRADLAVKGKPLADERSA